MLGQRSLANTRCANTPHILPVRGCLEEVGRLMRGDFYIGRGSRNGRRSEAHSPTISKSPSLAARFRSRSSTRRWLRMCCGSLRYGRHPVRGLFVTAARGKTAVLMPLSTPIVFDSVTIAAQKAPCETYPHVWNDSTSLNIDDPPRTCASEDSPASVPASASHDCDGFTLQGKGTATCAESFGAKSSATALTTQVCHFYGCT